MIKKILSYPRAILAFIFVIAWTAFWSSVNVIGYLFIKGQWLGNFVVVNWSRGILRAFNVNVEVVGRENLLNEPALFLFNHCSLFDIPILFWVMQDRTLRFGAKAELFRVPVFGGAMKAMGTLEIHRDKREKVLSLYQSSLRNMLFGFNYILAPEGTRQDGKQLGRFKSGPFIMAISGQCHITPVVIYGAHQILTKRAWIPSWGRWDNPVKVIILPAVNTKGLVVDQRDELQNQVFQMMSSEYQKHSPLS